MTAGVDRQLYCKTQTRSVNNSMTRTQTKIYVSFHCSETFCKSIHDVKKKKMFFKKIVAKNRAPITSAQGLKCFINIAMQQCSTVTKRHQSEVASPWSALVPRGGHPGHNLDDGP